MRIKIDLDLLLFFTMLLSSSICFADYNDSYQRGYKDGYQYGDGDGFKGFEPLPTFTPFSEIGRTSDRDGYLRGAKDGMKAYEGGKL